MNAAINVNANFARVGFRQRKEVIGPLKSGGTVAGVACSLGGELHEDAMLGREAAQAAGIPLNDKRYVNDLLRATIGHEFGHILGLRHNFLASTYHSPQALANPKIVRESGVTASLMDYTGFNIFGLHSGADLFSRTIGPYDIWAIQYGYSTFAPGHEKAGLQKIAARSNEPGLAYETDGAADDYDPTVARYDLSSDDLAYASRSFGVTRRLIATLGKRMPARGQSYAEFTNRLKGLVGSNVRDAGLATNYIGGAIIRRAVRGDQGEKLPFKPISAATQKKALTLLANNFFGPSAFSIPAAYFQRTEGNPFDFDDDQLDSGFPLRDFIAQARSAVLNDLLSPDRLKMMANLEYKFPEPGATLPIIQYFPLLRKAIWGTPGAKTVVGPLQRDLERQDLNLLVLIATNKRPGTPADARVVAQSELRQLKSRLEGPRRTSPDAYTRLHFADSIRRIDAALREKLS
jgi:hypothetical protein